MVVDRALDDIVKANKRKRQQQKVKKQNSPNKGGMQKNTGNRRNFNNSNNNKFRNNNNNQNNRGSRGGNRNSNFNRGFRFNAGRNRNTNGNSNKQALQTKNGGGGARNFTKNFGQMMRNAHQNKNVRNGNGQNQRNSNSPQKRQNMRGRQSFLNRRPPTTARTTDRRRTVGKNRNVGPIRTSRVAPLTTRPKASPGQDKPVQIHVGNLHFKVSEKDMRELFGEFGKLTKVNLHHDKNGKPQGSCDINFAKKSDALKAVKRYNKVPLDGRPMEIRVIEDFGGGQTAARVGNAASKPMSQRIARAAPAGGRRVQNVRPMNAMRQKMIMKVRKSAGRANKVKNLQKQKQAKSAPATKVKKIIKKKPAEKAKKITEEDLDKQLDAYLTAGSML